MVPLAFALGLLFSPTQGALIETDVGRQAIAAFAAGQLERACLLVSQALESGGLNTVEAAALAFLRALARRRRGLGVEEGDLVPALTSGTIPGLASHAAFYLASAHAERGEGEELVNPLLEQVAFPGRFGLPARLLKVRLLLSAGQLEEACALASSTARTLWSRIGEDEALLALAACEERLGRSLLRDDPEAGRAHLQSAARALGIVQAFGPYRPSGLRASASLASLGLRAKPDPAEILARGRELLTARRGTRDLALWNRLRALLPADLSDRARAEAEIIWAELLLTNRRFGLARAAASRVLALSTDPEVKSRAALLLGRLLSRYNNRLALEAFENIPLQWPTTRAAAGALYLAGALKLRLGQYAEAEALFLRCADEHATKPTALLCRFGVAWSAYRAGHASDALAWLEPLCAEASPEDVPPLADLAHSEPEIESADESADEPEDLAPTDLDPAAPHLAERTCYWRARILEDLGDAGAAVAQYRKLLRTSPFSFYPLLAWQRLDALGAAPTIAGDEPEQPPDFGTLHPEIAAAIVYHQMGLSQEVMATLAPLTRRDLLPVDRRWAARLLEAQGKFALSHRMAPVPLDRGLPRYPEAAWREDARLAFPRAFAELVEGSEREPTVPPSLLYAIIRAESGFAPTARSPALARGLTQVIARTAWSIARKLNLRRFSLLKLYDPPVAIQIGSVYLSELLARYRHPALAVCAYNAGEQAVDRWLEERPDLPLDAFIEEIPYAETARYVRRVLTGWAVYRMLYEAAPTPFDTPFGQQPTSLGNLAPASNLAPTSNLAPD